MDDALIIKLATALSGIANRHNLIIEKCAEGIELSQCNIAHGHCIDKELIERIIGCPIDIQKDKNQRQECGCVESTEVGAYNTCLNGCKYCYANFSNQKVAENRSMYDPVSLLLCGTVSEQDHVTERKVKSIKVTHQQMSFLK